MRPVHPGEILREDFLAPLEMSVNALALALGVPATRIHEIAKERRSITADTAERLARYFGGDAESWMSLQAAYDLKTLPSGFCRHGAAAGPVALACLIMNFAARKCVWIRHSAQVASRAEKASIRSV